MTPQSPNEALQPETAPPPPPKPPSRRRPTLSTISGFLSFLVIVAIGALVAVVWGSNHLQEPGPLTADKIVYIERHTDSADILNKLESEGVIDNKWLFQATLLVEGKSGKIKFGEFHFKQHASMRSVMDTLVNNKQFLHPFTVPEGLTSTQIVQRLRDNDIFAGDIKDIPKDGTLLPETYKFPRGWSRNDVLTRMQDDDRHAVEQIWARRSPDLPLRSPYELVTLASIVEKETGRADERTRVAGVFINRLQRHMRLQSDPTIVYGLVGGQGTLGHSITRAELDKRTPYNTYQIDGLPPGPIDNPGRAALEAVANPSRTQDLYFVADGTGGHAFSSSIEDHNRNVQRWRQIERDAKDKVDIDKLAPSATQPPGGGKNQRSDATDPVFGALPKTIGTVSLGQMASLADPTSNHDFQVVAATEGRGLVPARPPRHGKPAVAVDINAMTASIDSMGFSLDGNRPTPTSLLDGPPTPEVPPASPAPAFPSTVGRSDKITDSVATDTSPKDVSSTSLASTNVPATTPPTTNPSKDGSAKATENSPSRQAHARLEAVPSEPEAVDLFADPTPGSAAAPAAPLKAPPIHPKIYDVSEGTALDPLKMKSYDLNTAKTIPSDLGR